MKFIIYIWLLLLCQVAMAQEYPQLEFGAEWDKAKVVDNLTTDPTGKYASGNIYTSAVFTYNPRVENGYYLVDIYLARGGVKNPDDYESLVNEIWENDAANDCSQQEMYSVIGGFSVSFALKGGMGEISFVDIFDSNDKSFELSSAFNSDGDCPMALLGGDISFGRNQITVAYRPNMPKAIGRNGYGYSGLVRLEAHTPLYAGTLKLKIKNTSYTSALSFRASACSASPLIGSKTNPDFDTKSTYYVAVGWLDGKNPDIRLDGKTEPDGPTPPPAPAINVPTDTKLCLAKEQGPVSYAYSFASPADTVTYHWFVSAESKPKLPVNNAIAEWAPGNPTTVIWKAAGTFWVNGYVTSKATGLVSDTISQKIVVYQRPIASMTFDPSSPIEGQQLIATVSSSPAGAVAHWLKPGVVDDGTTTYTLSGNNVTVGTHEFEAYVKNTTTGCADTIAKSVTVGAKPKLLVDADSTSPLCAQGATVLKLKSVTDEIGNVIDLSNCTIEWTKADGTKLGSGTEQYITDAGTYKVKVVNNNSTPSAEGSDQVVIVQAGNAPVLAGNVFTVKSRATSTVICANVQSSGSSDLTWNWSTSSFLSATNVARPLLTNSSSNPLPADQNTFTTYVTDNTTNCRSKNTDVIVNVNSTNGIQLQLEPASLEICKGNHVFLTAKVNGTVDNSCTYTWEPNLGTAAQVEYTSNSAYDGLIYVTVVKNGYKAMAQMHMKVKNYQAPTLERGSELAHCVGDQITVSSTATNFTWIKNGSVDVSVQNNVYVFNATGDYNMSVTVSDANCTSDSVAWPKITIKQAPVLQPLALKSGRSVICGDEDVLVLTSNVTPDSIKWYMGGTEVAAAKNKTELTVTEAGSYHATAWVGQCFTTTDAVELNRIAMPVLTRLEVQDSCGQAVVLAVASNAASYIWSPDSYVTSTSLAVGSKATITKDHGYANYNVSLEIANGVCTQDTTFRVKLLQKPEFTIAMADEGKQCSGDVITAVMNPVMQNIEYSWYKGSALITDNHTNRYVLTENNATEKISLTVKAQNGCKTSWEHDYRIYPKPELAWVNGLVPPDTAVIDGTQIKVQVEASQGTGLYTYYFDKPYATPISNNSGVLSDGKQYTASIGNNPAEFFIWVEDEKGCKDTLTTSVGIKGVPLEVEIENKHQVYACRGGSVMLIAHVKKGVGALSYRWFNRLNPTVTVGSDDSVLIIQNFDINGILNIEYGYGVEVTCATTQGDGRAEIKLYNEAASHTDAPVIAANPKLITVRQRATTVLAATLQDDQTNPQHVTWYWSPDAYLQAGESNNQYPLTKEIDKATDFQVYVIDSTTHCMSNVDEVAVRYDNANGLKIQIEPEHPEICKNNSSLLSVKVSYPSGATGFTTAWTSEGTLSANNKAAVRFMTDGNTAAGDYLQVVQVTYNGYTALARNVVTVKSNEAPKLYFENGNRFCSGIALVARNSGYIEADNGYTWIVNGTPHTGQTATYSFAEHAKYDVKVLAQSDGNSCWSDTLSATVFQTPVINTITPGQKVAMGQELDLQVTVTPQSGMKGSWTSSPANMLATVATTEPKLTAKTKTMSVETDFTYTIKNAEENTCQADTTITIEVSAGELEINAEKDSISICAGEVLAVNIRPGAGHITEPITYEITSTSPDFTGTKTVSGIVGTYPFTSAYTATSASFTTPGAYELRFKATNANGAIGRDTVKFTVRSVPSIELLLSGTQRLCVGSGDVLPVQMNLSGGTSWDIKYSLAGTEKTVTGVTSSFYSENITAAGAFKILSVTNSENCSVSAGLPSLTIEDITPKAEFAAVTADSVCLPTDVTHELQLTLSGKLEYPLILYYHKDNGDGQVQRLADTSAAKALVADGGVGAYHLDSVINFLGCTSKTNASAAVKELLQYKRGVPDISFAAAEVGLCQGTTVEVPLSINGGTPEYHLTGTLGGTAVEYTVAAGASTITVNKSGMLKLTAVTDVHGCADADLAGVQINIADWAKPALTLNSVMTEYTFCDGGGTAVLPITVNGGDPEWKIYYKVGANAYCDTVKESAATWNWQIGHAGTLTVDSVVNNQGCRGQAAGVLLSGVTVTDDRPTATFANAGSETICGGTNGSPIALTVTTEAWPVTVWYHKVGQASVPEMISVQALTIKETGTYVLDSIRDNNGCRGTVNTTEKPIENGSLDITVKLDAPEGLLCKGDGQLDIPLQFTGKALIDDNSRKFTISYTFTPAGGGVKQELSLTDVPLSDMYANNVKIANAALGQYTLTGIAEDGGCTGEVSAEAVEKTVNVGTLPSVETDSVDFVLHKGERYVLGVKNANATANTYEWQKLPDAYAAVSAPFTVSGTMEDADLQYVLKAKDKNSGCANTDSVTIYRLPEPLILEIDTNTNRYNLKLTWRIEEETEPKDLLDGFLVMHNKWDAYALETKYTTKRSFGSGVSELKLHESELDTLEFFYVQAYRSLSLNGERPKSYYSLSSDTVGYYKQILQQNSVTGGLNLISHYFDMTKVMHGNNASNYITSVVDPSKVIQMSVWDFTQQEWVSCFDLGDGDWIGDFELELGLAYHLEVSEPCSYLEYGKLPQKITYNFTSGIKGSLRSALLPLHYIKLRSTGDIINHLANQVMVSHWDFILQEFLTTFYIGEMIDPVPLKPLNPILIELDGVPSVIWK